MPQENRKRPIQLKFRVTQEEHDFIMEKVKLAGMQCYGDYLREQAIKGYVIELDYSPLKGLAREIGYIGRSINQIAKRINTTHTIYKEDLEEIQACLKQVWQMIRDQMHEALRLRGKNP